MFVKNILPKGVVTMKEIKNTDKSQAMNVPKTQGLFDAFGRTLGLFDAMVCGFSGILLYLDTDLKVIWANDFTFGIFDHVIGSDCCTILGLEQSNCTHCFIRSALDEKTIRTSVCDGRIPLVDTSGNITEHAVFEITASPVEESGVIVGALAVVDNITERIQLEKRLRQTQKMEAIATLARGVAHDFNNVLTPIIGYSEIIRLKMRQDGVQDTLVEEYLGEILVASRRAKQLVEQMLTFSKNEERQQTRQYVQPIIQEVARLMRTMLPSTVKISQDLDEDCGRIFIDSGQLHQVLVNLCTNSGHAMENSHGELTLSLQPLEIDELGEYWLRITVADTGCGIDPALLERIFDPYFTTREKQQGTGMGLAVVHGIVHNQAGRISVESEIGVGTSFYLDFQMSDGKTSVEQVVDLRDLQHGQGNVLLVDDEEQVVEVSTEILRHLGYAVSGLTSSREALAMFLKSPDSYDLLVTDLTMPEMTGIELCREIKKIRPDVPVVLCTGYNEKVSSEILEKMGVDRYCVKPVSMKNFADTVGALLR